MATLEPSTALATCESALRELMSYAFTDSYGPDWLNAVATPSQLETWAERAAVEGRVRVPKGVARVPNAGLAYANFFDLIEIADKHWEPLAAALGKKSATLPLLQRFEALRNTIGHSRPLILFEQELLSGIAGQIRNQVTVYMSAQDEVGEIYPRIESVTDSFGRRIESAVAAGEVAGSVMSHDIVVRPGDVVRFECVGLDPQGRDLEWHIPHSRGSEVVVARSGEVAILEWRVLDEDVRESHVREVFMKAVDSPYHRFGRFDHRAYFNFRVRPPV